MSRPRHREKSSLLWKMLGIAAAVNLVLWPVLVHEGIFAGIRREVLIPVTLVSLPPSHKLPDTLQRVARVVPVSHLPASRIVSAPHRFPGQPVRAEAAVVLPRLNKPLPAPEKESAAASGVPHPQAVADAVASEPARQAAERNPFVPSIPAASAFPRQHYMSPVIAARIARAKELEAQGHQVAEWIAQHRVRTASLPPPVAPAAPVPIAATTAETPLAAAAPVHKDARPPTPTMTPALAVWKAYPAVPDSMMKSAWHATFRGVFTVRRDGNASVTMVSSTGFPILDRKALGAARRWKFRPARQNGVAVVSSQPFVFEYDVHPVR